MKRQREILVVEDSATQAMALCTVLEEQGFDVKRVSSGEEAVAHLEHGTVDLVLSDIVMPGMSGYDLCRHVKESPRLCTLPVVLLTSLGDPLDIVRGLECGADNYVTKPYDPDYLCARIRHVLDRQRLRASPKASLGVNVSFLGTSFSITSDKEQILDLFISTVEDVVRTNQALQESQRELAAAQARLEEYARGMTLQAQASTERYAALMHHASDAIVVLGPSGRILEANQRATELFGVSLDALPGRALRDFAAAESATHLDAQFQRLHALPRVTTELEFVNAAGQIAACVLSASRTRSGETDLILAIIHDVTAIRDAANRVQKSQRQLEQAQQISGVGSWGRDLESGISEWSAETFRILGLPVSAGQDLQHVFLARIDDADRAGVVDAIAATVAKGEPLSIECRVHRPDGTTRVVHLRGERAQDERGGRKLLGTIQDITERRQLEEQLHQSQKMEAVGQLAGGVAHDFNNLLTVITSYCGILLADLPGTDPKRTEIGEIEKAAQRAAGLTRQLLAFSRRQVLRPQQVRVDTIIGQLEKLLRRLVREDIEIITTLGAQGGGVWADPGQLEQVLVNLVVNARDAMPAGGTLTIRTATTRYPADLPPNAEMDAANGNCVLIEVSDNGTGMSPAIQARIFEPFFTTKAAGQGTGLGLSTVFGIVRQSGGEISVESTIGVGTTFRVYLPRRDGVAEPATSADAPTATPLAGGETVLVVEDDDALRFVACRILRKLGYDVLEARDGREALEICAGRREPLHLVLTDMVMPEMSGYALGAQIAARHPEVAVLFMSGYTRDSVIREGITQGSNPYLEKPFTPESLGTKVREVLDSERRARKATAS